MECFIREGGGVKDKGVDIYRATLVTFHVAFEMADEG